MAKNLGEFPDVHSWEKGLLMLFLYVYLFFHSVEKSVEHPWMRNTPWLISNTNIVPGTR